MINYCRYCEEKLNHTFIDLGETPLSNSYLKKSELQQKEAYYPLHVKVCQKCLLVQLPLITYPEEIFRDYAYFSSYSDSWLNHAKNYVNFMYEKYQINADWHIVEIASNDGYLLQYFKEKKLNVLGIEPAYNVAEKARSKGIRTLTEFFNTALAHQLKKDGLSADLLIANNVLAHVPELCDFIQGIKILLKDNGILTLEFPHLLKLINENQFDTIYHEHYSYFSFLTIQKILSKFSLEIFDVEELNTHGGSLRLFVKHAHNERPIERRVFELIDQEKNAKLHTLTPYTDFKGKAQQIKQSLNDFFTQIKKESKSIAAYGAPAKGNTLLNFCGISRENLPFTVDRNSYKQDRFLPGSKIPIYHPSLLDEGKPDYVLILPWNIKEEIMSQLAHIKAWGGKFVIAIPTLQII